MIEKARTSPFPPKNTRPKLIKKRRAGSPTHMLPPPPPPPLPIQVKIIEGPPMPYEFRRMFPYRPEYTSLVHAFLNMKRVTCSTHATNAEQLYKVVREDMSLLRWPIVVHQRFQYYTAGNKKEVDHLLRRIAEKRALPKLEPTPFYNPNIVQKERDAMFGAAYIERKEKFLEKELKELEGITS